MISPIVNLVLALPSLPSIPSEDCVGLYQNITMSCCPLSLISQADITYMEWNYIHMIPYSEELGHIFQLRILSPLISRHVEAFFFKSSRHFFPNLSPLFLQSHFFQLTNFFHHSSAVALHHFHPVCVWKQNMWSMNFMNASEVYMTLTAGDAFID